MIQDYVGDGKGKTTTSIGLSIRAVGHGYNVMFMQFLKDDSSGEVGVRRSVPGISVLHSSVNHGWLFNMTEDQKTETAREYDKMLDEAEKSDVFLIMLDEVIHALNAGLVSRQKLE